MKNFLEKPTDGLKTGAQRALARDLAKREAQALFYKDTATTGLETRQMGRRRARVEAAQLARFERGTADALARQAMRDRKRARAEVLKASGKPAKRELEATGPGAPMLRTHTARLLKGSTVPGAGRAEKTKAGTFNRRLTTLSEPRSALEITFHATKGYRSRRVG